MKAKECDFIQVTCLYFVIDPHLHKKNQPQAQAPADFSNIRLLTQYELYHAFVDIFPINFFYHHNLSVRLKYLLHLAK